jgi:hypothetical protein
LPQLVASSVNPLDEPRDSAETVQNRAPAGLAPAGEGELFLARSPQAVPHVTAEPQRGDLLSWCRRTIGDSGPAQSAAPRGGIFTVQMVIET